MKLNDKELSENIEREELLAESYAESFKPDHKLSEDEEIQLIKAWREHKDIKARDVVLSNAFQCCARQIDKWPVCITSVCDKRDLYSEAIVILMRAINSYDCQSGYRFSTYACIRIARMLAQIIARDADGIGLAQTTFNNKRSGAVWKIFEEIYDSQLPIEKKRAELQQSLDITKDEITFLEDVFYRNCIDVDDLYHEIELGILGEDTLTDLYNEHYNVTARGNLGCYLEEVTECFTDHPENNASEIHDHLKEVVESSFNRLSKTEQRLITDKYLTGKYNGMNDTEIAKELNITRQAVNIALRTALRKLRRKFDIICKDHI